jgi:hypothetical protein
MPVAAHFGSISQRRQLTVPLSLRAGEIGPMLRLITVNLKAVSRAAGFCANWVFSCRSTMGLPAPEDRE